MDILSAGTTIDEMVRQTLATYTPEEREKLDTALLDAYILPALNMGKMEKWQRQIVEALMSGKTVQLFKNGRHQTFKPMEKTISLAQLFKGLEPLLGRIMESFGKGTSAKAISLIYIHPVIKQLEENAGQDMDELYIAYMLQAAYNQIGK